MARTRIYRDRRAAGVALAEALPALAGEDPVVLALPRGGVPVAYEVARALHAPLDVLLVRKVGAPGNAEFGIGAIAEGGVLVLDRATIGSLLISLDELERSVERARAELAARLERYRRGRPAVDLHGRTAIVVDDGLATGGTASAALRAVRERGARHVVLAVPVGSRQAVERLRPEADDVVCLETPANFRAVGAWYRDFDQTSDAVVADLLERGAGGVAPDTAPAAAAGRSARRAEGRDHPAGRGAADRRPHPPGARPRAGDLRSRQRQQPAQPAQPARRGAAGRTPALRPCCSTSSPRPRSATGATSSTSSFSRAGSWRRRRGPPPSPAWRISPSATSAPAPAPARRCGRPRRPSRVCAPSSRAAGAPTSRCAVLDRVDVPVLLIVGGEDRVVLELNREALAALGARSRLVTVPGATHLFEEPGALDSVAALATDWFEAHLAPDSA